MNKRNLLFFFIMHLGFLYSLYTIVAKIASKYEFLSFNFCFFYFVLIFILFVYAILWQQILKVIPLTFATANKSVTIVWGMLWSFLFFNEVITIKKIIGAVIIAFVFVPIYGWGERTF